MTTRGPSYRFEELELLYRTAPLGLGMVDRELRYVQVNQRLGDFAGFSPEQMLGRTTREIVPGLAPKTEPIYRRVFETGEPVLDVEVSGPTRAQPGRKRHWLASYSPVEAGGEVVGVSIVVQDVTERQEAKGALEERAAFERLLTDVARQFCMVEPEGVDELMCATLRRVCEFLGAERSAVTLFSADRQRLSNDYVWVAEGLPVPSSLVGELDSVWHWFPQQAAGGHVLMASSIDDLPAEAAEQKAFLRREGIQSLLLVPIQSSDDVAGALVFDTVRQPRTWPPELVQRLKLIASLMASTLARKGAHDRLREALGRARAENVYLREEATRVQEHDLVGESPGLLKVLREAEQVAATDSTVLVQGETGTGKCLLAAAIHGMSPRRDRTLVTVNCATLPSTLIESELFGREKGAYTGALARQVGRFELADGSTLFLDEVSELPVEVQAKLLRVLQDGEFERLGSTKTLKVDVRIIAATNRDLGRAVREGVVREDLYYRLNVFPITVPPLRERRDDIPRLVWAFVKELSEKMGKRIDSIPRKTMEELQSYSWPGNVRELRNVVERAMIVAQGPTLRVELSAGEPASGTSAADLSMDAVQRRHIVAVLKQTGGRVRGSHGAAEILGMKPTTLESRMAKLGITDPS